MSLHSHLPISSISQNLYNQPETLITQNCLFFSPITPPSVTNTHIHAHYFPNPSTRAGVHPHENAWFCLLLPSPQNSCCCPWLVSLPFLTTTPPSLHLHTIVSMIILACSAAHCLKIQSKFLWLPSPPGYHSCLSLQPTQLSLFPCLASLVSLQFLDSIKLFLAPEPFLASPCPDELLFLWDLA